MGGATTQWLSYAHAVHSSPGRERFGKGAIEGVLGPGASNNSTLGGSLITTISFGIPASVFMAILMGAFIMHGVVPGPDMLKPESAGGHLGLTYSFVWIVVISNLITVGIIFLLLKQIVKVTYVRGAILIPFIIMLIFLGAYAEKNAFADLVLVLLFGVLGWALQKFNWPRPPLILGLVLGGLAENRLFLSVENYGLAWLYRPIVLFLIAATLFGAVMPILKIRREKKERQKVMRLGGTAAIDTAGTVSLPADKGAAAFALFLVVVLAAALWESRNFNIRAGLFPWVVGFPLLGFCCIQCVKEIVGRKSNSSRGRGSTEEASEVPLSLARRRTATTFGWVFFYFLSIWMLGFPIGGSLCCFLQLKFASREKWLLTLTLTAAVWAFTYLLFERTLHVPFPVGYLFEIAGWAE